MDLETGLGHFQGRWVSGMLDQVTTLTAIGEMQEDVLCGVERRG